MVMTDNKIENEWLLDAEDEKLLQGFFADCRVEMPDDGFSEKVMASLPVRKYARLEQIWLTLCLLMGVAAFFLENGWGRILVWLSSIKVEPTLDFIHQLPSMADILPHVSVNFPTVLAGIVTLAAVWGYNVVMDARARY